jgi:asparagine synthase (glutamine-hydrolysing)
VGNDFGKNIFLTRKGLWQAEGFIMCGIVGIILSGKENLTSQLQDALKRIAHRGPDDEGIWLDETIQKAEIFSVGLGHVRLSILDLSAKGRQPMTGKDGAVIAFNGEIYNYLELREELKQLGHKFHTETDTEVILAAYKQWGEDCVERFVGMWAFGIWNGKCLFLSRDRLGKKPLYIYQNSEKGFFAFASEIKGFKAIPGVPWLPDETTVYRYLAFGEMEQNGATFYQCISEFPAGASMTHVPGDETPRLKKYWVLSDQQYDVDEREAVAKTEELLHDSLRLRLRSDAPLGLSLSGGLDSTLLLSLMNEAGISAPSTFSTRYAEPGYSETRYIDMATERLGCTPSAAVSDVFHFKKDFERLVYHLDQPSRLPGPYSQWRVAALATNKVKVLIDGQGADELAGGYVYYLPISWRDSAWQDRIRYFPDLFLTAWANRHIATQYPLHLIWERVRGKAEAKDNLPLRQQWASQFSQDIPVWESFSHLNAMLRHAVVASSLPPLLRYGDRVNMAFGIENRCPFLDHRLVTYVSHLPSTMKIRGGQTKWIFRAVAKHRIPELILNRRMKMGFPTPVGSWIRNELLETAYQWLDSYKAFPLYNRWIDIDRVLELLKQHAAKRADHQALLWRLLSVGAWLKTAELQ